MWQQIVLTLLEEKKQLLDELVDYFINLHKMRNGIYPTLDRQLETDQQYKTLHRALVQKRMLYMLQTVPVVTSILRV